MKRIVTIITGAALILSLAACSSDDDEVYTPPETAARTTAADYTPGGNSDDVHEYAEDYSDYDDTDDIDEFLEMLGDTANTDEWTDIYGNDRSSYFSANIDTSGFDPTLFDGRIALSRDIIVDVPLTYDKIIALGYVVADEEREKVVLEAGSIQQQNMRYDINDDENDIHESVNVIVVNTTDEDKTALELFKEGVFSIWDYMSSYSPVPPVIMEQDGYKRPNDSYTPEEFSDVVFGAIGVPSRVLLYDSQYSNFNYVYDYGDYYLILYVKDLETPNDIGGLKLSGYEYLTKSFAEADRRFE